MKTRSLAVLGLTAATFLLAFWAFGRVEPHYYYTVGVRSMSESWHAFFYGAFDPAGTISVDKVPGALWMQALSVRVFGFHAWAVLLPQALAAAATVPVLYSAVRLWIGTRAGLIAAAVFALTPITVVLARVNIPDTFLVLCMVCAALATSKAIKGGRWPQLLIAAVWIGVGFQMKMTQAFLVLPALGIAYLVAAPGGLVSRLARTAVAGVLALAVSSLWLIAVALTPAADRPYVDGSTNNSVWEMALLYNGFGRFSHGTAATDQVSSFLADFGGAAGPFRLFNSEIGVQISWLLPLALIAVILGLVVRKSFPRKDFERAGVIMWGTWLLTHAVLFSAAPGIHPYYTAALAPAVAALAAYAFHLNTWVGIVGTGAWAVVLCTREDLVWLGIVIAVGVAVALVARLPAVAVAAVLAGPAVFTVMASGKVLDGLTSLNPVAGQGSALSDSGMAAMHGMPPDMPFPPGMGDMNMVTPNVGVLQYVKQNHTRERYMFAVPTANTAAPYLRAGYSVLPMGGFTGAAAVPSIVELQELVRSGQVRHVLIGGFHGGMGGGTSIERQEWVAKNCAPVPVADYQGASGPSGPPGHPELLFDCRPGGAR
ncbi:glycosyltransferase family 39 protein [Allokutzneria sp. A3M-2-11 16]|uniref:ArnT family glycosyltransferase n=1 Tax=Allokutzneria sp. A3M-2-11 16 TaxID=2962043 RepID=UPI0020B77582|nr:glycosyltransferase family 39 protein [Allokutzneria sp. A3M-2-11 16]MCP3797663.1 glycosyltransferase family 39 protein [Allokutzneria sp. A3M-2-11 16]